jgi:hypothetical protein
MDVLYKIRLIIIWIFLILYSLVLGFIILFSNLYLILGITIYYKQKSLKFKKIKDNVFYQIILFLPVGLLTIGLDSLIKDFLFQIDFPLRYIFLVLIWILGLTGLLKHKQSFEARDSYDDNIHKGFNKFMDNKNLSVLIPIVSFFLIFTVWYLCFQF